MHTSALQNCQCFFEAYASAFSAGEKVRVIEIGSQDVNGSLRALAPSRFEYIGIDFVPAKGVDIVISDPYVLPFEANSVDIVLSSSCFEHSEMFWITFLEIMRVLKPTGLFYLNAPSNGAFHRYPVDCWRFYPDSGRALVTWAKRNNINAVLLESYTSGQLAGESGHWNDFVAVFGKNEDHAHLFEKRILDSKKDITNGQIHGREGFINPSEMSEDRRKLIAIDKILSNQIKVY
jgi:SAM-dependent methyltransferase